MEIFKLVGSIFVDNEEANNSIAKTEDKAGSLASKLGEGIGTAAKWGAGIAAAATAGAGAVMELANNAAGAADTIDKCSIRMGISTDAYQEFAYAAGQSGVEMSTLEKAAKKLEGTDINFENAMSQIMALSSAEERAAKASELFGDAVAYQMSPLIEQSSEDLQGLIDRSHELGLVMDGDAVSAGVEFGDTLSDIKQSLGAMVTQLGSKAMPVIQKFFAVFMSMLPSIQSLFDTLALVVVNLVEDMLPPLMDLAEQLLPIIVDLVSTLVPVIADIASAILPILAELLSTLLPPLVEIIQILLPPLSEILLALLPIVTAILELISPLLDLLLQLIVPLIDLTVKCIQPLMDALIGLIDLAIEPVTEAFQRMFEKVSGVFSQLWDDISTVFDDVKKLFGDVITFVKDVFAGDWRKAWDDIVQIFKDLWNLIVDYAKVPLNLLIGYINSFLDGFTSGINLAIKGLNSINIKVPNWVPGIGGNSFGFDLDLLKAPEIPYLQEGAEITRKGQLFVANEAGPELVGSFDGRNAVANNKDVLNMVGQRVRQETQPLSTEVVKILSDILELLKAGVQLDGEMIARFLAPGIDNELGDIRGGMRA